MLETLRGRRPDVTPAQLLAAIPMVVALLAVLGVFDLEADEREALKYALYWSFVLLAADALIRIGRNFASRQEGWDEVEGGLDLLIPPTEEDLAEAERLEAEAAELEPVAAPGSPDERP
jgi:hypothetical protein